MVCLEERQDLQEIEEKIPWINTGFNAFPFSILWAVIDAFTSNEVLPFFLTRLKVSYKKKTGWPSHNRIIPFGIFQLKK